MITFDEAYERITGNGWLTRDEARLLWDCALATTGDVVEIGSYRGRSAMLLAQAIAPVHRRLFCVDPWDDAFDSGMKGDDIYANFCDNINHLACSYESGYAQIVGCVIPCRIRVEEWSPVPAGLVYCDGDHTYEGTLAQIRKAISCNPQIIAVHDYSNSVGGREIVRACQELLRKPLNVVGTMAVWHLGVRAK